MSFYTLLFLLHLTLASDTYIDVCSSNYFILTALLLYEYTVHLLNVRTFGLFSKFAFPKNIIVNVLVHDSLYAWVSPGYINRNKINHNFTKYWKLPSKVVKKISSTASSTWEYYSNTLLATQKTGRWVLRVKYLNVFIWCLLATFSTFSFGHLSFCRWLVISFILQLGHFV